MGKYRNVKVVYDGIKFDSMLEASVYKGIILREKAGIIKFVSCQDTVYLTDARVRCRMDFKCQDVKSGEFFWVEAKGKETPTWRLKRKLWIAGYGPGPLEIWKGSHAAPKLHEIVSPIKK